jgi:hypothetical protein
MVCSWVYETHAHGPTTNEELYTTQPLHCSLCCFCSQMASNGRLFLPVPGQSLVMVRLSHGSNEVAA